MKFDVRKRKEEYAITDDLQDPCLWHDDSTDENVVNNLQAIIGVPVSTRV